MRRPSKALCLILMLVVIFQMPITVLATTQTIGLQGHISGATTVTYHPNGGTGGLTESIPDEAYTVLDDTSAGVAYSGYDFTGWNSVADGSGVSYKPGDNITLSEDLTLYAQWNSKTNYISSTINTTTTQPKTGDRSDSALYLSIMLLALFVIVLIQSQKSSKKSKLVLGMKASDGDGTGEYY